MDQPLVWADLHHHLGTNTYRGPFDRVMDIVRKRMGPKAVIAVVSTGDDRCPHGDRRFEKFADSFKCLRKKYDVYDLGGRALFVQPGDITVYNAVEAELGDGSVLIVGLQRDTSDLISGRGVTHEGLFQSLEGLSYAAFEVHPCHKHGSEKFLKEAINKPALHCYIQRLTGMEVFNGEACLPYPWEYRGANEDAYYLFLEAHDQVNSDLAPVIFGDGHTLFELGRISTQIPYPAPYGARGLFNGDEALKNLKASFAALGREAHKARTEGSLLEKAVGVLGAIHHGAYLMAYRPLAMKRGWMTEKDW